MGCLVCGKDLHHCAFSQVSLGDEGAPAKLVEAARTVTIDELHHQ